MKLTCWSPLFCKIPSRAWKLLCSSSIGRTVMTHRTQIVPITITTLAVITWQATQTLLFPLVSYISAKSSVRTGRLIRCCCTNGTIMTCRTPECFVRITGCSLDAVIAGRACSAPFCLTYSTSTVTICSSRAFLRCNHVVTIRPQSTESGLGCSWCATRFA